MVRQSTSYSKPQTGRCLRRTLIFCAVDIWIYGFVVYCRIHQLPANKEQPYASIVYTAVAGGKAALPCDISSPTPDDSGTLVLWYKDGNIAPIFTLDSRHRRLDHVRRFLPEDLERRFLFDIGHSPAYLQIDSVQEADAGEYRCRVDFRQAHSVNTVIRLKVIGKPRPVVIWWHNKALVDSDFSFVDGGSVARNWLDIAELKRSDYLSVLTCQAANNNGTVAMSRWTRTVMNPLDVSIQPPRQRLSAGHLSHLVRSSSVSRPAALLTWWTGGEQIFSSQEHTRNLNDTRSNVLYFTPRQNDNGAILSCRAENTFIPGSAIEHGMQLNILYQPQVLLRLGHNLQKDNIREGGDVYLECDADANPSASEVTWLFDDDEIITNTSAGIIMHQCASRARSTCASQNDLVSVNFEVEADPMDVTFEWRFDSSVSGKRLELSRFRQKLTHSVALHTTLNENDFGLLLCWATNDIGKQRKPCAFAVVRAGLPEPVRNCSQDNGTFNSVSFECSHGVWDGGMQPVVYVAELRDAHTNRLVANASSTSRPAFSFSGLEEGTTFRVLLYSTNPKGHREPVDFL
ncbi:hypothetical protein HPB51_022368 [Rhipicephalus microplus]|uniref:Ig-like domain-containing protein n=1 Tax=Rhipicephalus microplus TaxID=6941 RepID=A0A9J6DQN9_RHIMP|nr:hypothetical protein HPB51_022368 [Rhipicephalus microplus]